MHQDKKLYFLWTLNNFFAIFPAFARYYLFKFCMRFLFVQNGKNSDFSRDRKIENQNCFLGLQKPC